MGERADEPAKVSEKLRQNTFWQGRGGSVEHAISGIDIALWDLFGKITNQPVARLLGGFTETKSNLMDRSYSRNPMLLEKNLLWRLAADFGR